MAERREEKYLIDYSQYALLRDKAAKLLTPDPHGRQGSYVITSLYYDDPMDTALLEKQDGLATHTKFRLRTYDGAGEFVKLERKVKQGIITQKQTALVTREQIPLLGVQTQGFDGEALSLAAQMAAGGLRPSTTVRYRRDAFFYRGTDLRLTFDTNLEVLPAAEELLFDCAGTGIPALDKNTVIMEIKYGRYVPDFVRLLTAIPTRQLSVSKYALCREMIE